MFKEIKQEFKRYKNIFGEDINSEICDEDPFFKHHWMYYYLFPECLIVFDDYYKECYLKYTKIYPCWIMSEEQIIRVMAECGIL